jgi:hypothetical protein
MNTTRLAALALAAAAATTLASPALAADGLRFTVGTALTGGGEKLATVAYTDGSSQDVRSGGLVHLWLGFEYQAGAFALQGNLGYHVDDTSAKNGSVKFKRNPVELLGFWHVSDSVRLGGGVRKATGAEVNSSGAASSLGNYGFESKVGVVLQGEYFVTGDKFSVYGRYVAEDYTVYGVKVSGNHVGAGIAYRF